MAKLRITVGAALDRDATTAFAPIVESAKRARKQIEAELNAASKASTASIRKGVKDAEGAFKELADFVQGRSKTMMSAGTKAVVDFTKETKTSFDAAKKQFADLAREAEREMKRVETAKRGATGAAAGAGGGGGGRQGDGTTRFGRRVGYWSMRNFAPVTPTLAMGGRIAGDIARGAGVDLNVGSMVSSYVGRQKRAVDLSNAAYMPLTDDEIAKGVKPETKNVRQDPRALMAEATSAGMANAIDPEKALEGLQKFVAKTGDLETGRKILSDMARLSRATGAGLEDIVDAAGDVSNALGETDNKGAKVNAVMKAIAAQGKVGAVEIKDLAVQMAKLGAAAGQFSGKPEEVMAQMGALTQMTRAKGGAASSTQAATSVSSFVNTFSKGKRLDAFKKYGIETQGPGGRIRNSEEIILESLAKTKGDSRKMGELFMDVRARSVTRGFETIYKDAGGGQAGLVAVDKAFKELAKATMKEEELATSHAASMNTAEAKVQLFKNRIQETADKTAEKLLPALEKLAPTIERAAQAFADFLLWATDNPGKAIAVALSAAIAKAAIENTIRAGVEKLFSAGGGAGAVGGRGLGGNLAAAGVIASLAVTAITIGEAYIDDFYAKKTQEDKKDFADKVEAQNLASKARMTGAVSPEEQKKLEEQLVTLKSQAGRKRDEIGSPGGGVDIAAGAALQVAGLFSSAAEKEANEVQATRYAEQKRSYDQALASQKEVENILQRIKEGTLKVQVVNPPAADSSGRAPAPTKAGGN